MGRFLIVMLLVFCGIPERPTWAQAPAAAPAPAPTPEEVAAAIARINKAMEIKTADTAAFINNKLNDTFDVTTEWYTGTDGSPAKGVRVQQTANVHGCTIVTSGKYWNTREGKVEGEPDTWDTRVFAFRLLMTSSSVKVEKKGYHDQALYRLELAVKPDPPAAGGHISVYINDKSMADRLMNAFTGLGKMCGAKDEPY